eukprot:29954_1
MSPFSSLHAALACSLLFVSGLCASLSQWTLSNTTFPIDSTATQAICGYTVNSSNKRKLFILEDTNSMSYDVTGNKFKTHSPLSISISCIGQCYTQFDNYLYFAHDYNIGAFNMDTKEMQYPLSSQSLSAKGKRACLTISGDGKHLFILGGKENAQNIIDTFQIYHIDTQTLVTGPSIGKSNCCTASSCNIINDQLYWFGGYERFNGLQNRIEVIDVSNIANIASTSWQELTYSTHIRGRRYHKSVLFNGLIYYIGGEAQSDNQTSSQHITDLVESFDPHTGQIDLDTPLPVVMGYPCAVKGDDVIFVAYEQELYWTLLAPTDDPSTQPTINPSVIPTNAPSHDPSNAPSDDPSIQPSMHPTAHPSDPTNIPTPSSNNPTTRRLDAHHNSPTDSPQSTDTIVSTEGQSSTGQYDKDNGQSESVHDTQDEWIVIVSVIGSLLCVGAILVCIIFCVRKRNVAVVLSKHVEANDNWQVHNINEERVQDDEEVMRRLTLGGSALYIKEESDHDDFVCDVNTLGGEADALEASSNAKEFVPQDEEDGIVMGDDDILCGANTLDEGDAFDPQLPVHISKLPFTVEGPSGIEDCMRRESDNFDEMFVDVDENSVSKSEQNKANLHEETTKGADDEKVSFHGTKGHYYDEYHHQKYKERITNHGP